MTWLALTIALSTASPGSPRADRAGWRAHVSRLESFARAHPTDSAVALRLAAGLAARGPVKAAIRWADEAERRGAHPLRAALIRGDACFNAGRDREAALELIKVVIEAPNNAHAHLQLWRCLRRAPRGALGDALDFDRVRGVLIRAGYFVPVRFRRPVDTDSARAFTASGEAALDDGAFLRAAERFEAAISADDTHAAAYRGLALARSSSRGERLALGAYHQYLALVSDDAAAETRDVREARHVIDDAERRRGLEREKARAEESGRP